MDWRVIIGAGESRPGMIPVVFHCTSNSSFGWRVVEVAAETYGGKDPEELTDEQLDAMFADALPFGAPKDPKAHEDAIGHTRTR